MANANVAFGLKPLRHQSGAPYNGSARKYFIPATDGTAVYIGDPVKSGGTGDTDGMTPTVAQAAAGDTIRGVVVGVVADTATSLPYRAASTARYVLVADDPDLIFEVQEDSVGGALTITELGENADIIVAAGSTVTGMSGVMLDSSDHKTTTAQLRIIKLVNRPDNALGTNAKIEVLINEHELKSTSGL
jgi:hypothetical protein